MNDGSATTSSPIPGQPQVAAGGGLPRQRVLVLVLLLAFLQWLVWLAPPLPAARGIAGYVPLHTALEMCAIVVAALVAAIGFSTPDRARPADFGPLAGTFVGVALLDGLHTLSFQGMPALITPSSPEKAINFWLAARLLAAVGLLQVALLSARPRSGSGRWWLAGALAFVAVSAWVGLWHADLLPRTFIDGQGLTTFKRACEYALILGYGAAALLLWRRSAGPQAFDTVGLFGAAAVMAMSEAFFTLYGDVGDVFNLMGHVYKVVGYGFLCHSIFLDGVRRPFERLADANTALAASGARFRDLTLMASDWYWEQDAEFRFTLLTTGMRGSTPLPDDALGRRRWELPHRGIDDAQWARHRAVLERHEPFAGLVLQFRDGAGRWRWGSISGKPLFDADGRFTGYRGVGTDITERLTHEDALRRLNAELEGRVAERTAELARARDVAESASRAKSDFLSAMSHELRTPLNAILGFGHLLGRDAAQPLTPRQASHVRQVVQAGHHLLALITEVLDLSRIEAGKLDVTVEAVRLAPLIDDALALMQPLARERGVTLWPLAALPDDLHAVVDATRLRQVLLNLLSNAIKYNREGGQVRLNCTGNVSEVTLEVHDTGPGLDDADIARLFQPFERLSAAGGQVEGAGIGLALSRRLLGLMGGTIEVSSVPGEGCTFTVRLPGCAVPVPPSGAAPQAVPAAPVEPGPAARHQGRPRTVMHVEDNPVNAMLMEALFDARTDLRLASVAQAALALELATAEPPDLVLLDIQMPGMDGWELLRRLRANPATAAVPAVAVSANATPEDLARGHAAGFAAYLTKPFDVAELFATIDALLAPLAAGPSSTNLLTTPPELVG